MGKSHSKEVAPATINPYTGLPDVGPLPERAQVVLGGNNGPTIMCANAAVAKVWNGPLSSLVHGAGGCRRGQGCCAFSPLPLMQQVDGMDGKKDKHYKGVPIAICRDLSGMAAATGMVPSSTGVWHSPVVCGRCSPLFLDCHGGTRPRECGVCHLGRGRGAFLQRRDCGRSIACDIQTWEQHFPPHSSPWRHCFSVPVCSLVPETASRRYTQQSSLVYKGVK